VKAGDAPRPKAIPQPETNPADLSTSASTPLAAPAILPDGQKTGDQRGIGGGWAAMNHLYRLRNLSGNPQTFRWGAKLKLRHSLVVGGGVARAGPRSALVRPADYLVGQALSPLRPDLERQIGKGLGLRCNWPLSGFATWGLAIRARAGF